MNKKLSNPKAGFTYPEVMVATFVLLMFVMAVMPAAGLARHITETAIYETAAQNAARSWLEQIRSLPYSFLEDAARDYENGISVELPTQTIYSSGYTLSGTLVDAPLYVGQENPISPSMLDTFSVLIDVQRDDWNDPNSPVTEIRMPIKITPMLTRLDVGSNPIPCVEIELFYEYELPGRMASKTTQTKGVVKGVRSMVPIW